MKLKSKFSIPHVFIFLSAIILVCSILTYIIPSGEYLRESKIVDGIERKVVIPGSYEILPKHFSLKGIVLGDNHEGKATPVSFLGLFTSIPKGMSQSASLIFFVFIIGAVFNLIQHSGTINVVMHKLLSRFRNRPRLLFFIIFSTIFTLASFLGMGDEFIPMFPIFLIIAKELGYDRIFGLALYLIPMSIGWTAALTNPFNLQIAQKVAELPIGSGMWLRVVLFVLALSISFIYLMRYGTRVKNGKTATIMADDKFELGESSELKSEALQNKHIYIIITAFILFALILFAVQTMGWGLVEMSGGFFMVGLATILLSRMSGKEAMEAFTKGLESMVLPALIIGFARGIQVVLNDGMIIDTLLYHTSVTLQNLPNTIAVEGMYTFQSVLNFFIPSASGQALVSMPLMVPLGDLLGLSRQTTVLAYVMGDGFSNIIIPTSGILMAVLGIGGVPYEKWVKFIWPLVAILVTVGAILLYIAVVVNY